MIVFESYVSFMDGVCIQTLKDGVCIQTLKLSHVPEMKGEALPLSAVMFDEAGIGKESGKGIEWEKGK